MILPHPKDPQLTTLRRGGTLTDDHHRLLALWAASCADHVLALFEAQAPDDPRPRRALALARSWAEGAAALDEAKAGAFHANQAARPWQGAPRWAAYAAAQAAVVAHVAAHDLGAAAYALKAVMADAQARGLDPEAARRAEADWQVAQVPPAVRALVIEDRQRRNSLCWNLFEGSLSGGT